MRLPALLLIAPWLFLCTPSASADLWRWIDADGIVRYTPNPNHVPGSSRDSLARVEVGMPAAPAAATAALPTPLHAPADEFSFAADPFNAPDRAQTLRGDDVHEPLDPSATAPLGSERVTTATPTASTLPTAAPIPTSDTTPPVDGQPPQDSTQRERRAALTAQIERDEARLKELISSGATGAGEPPDELREIAERLPRLQAELRELEGGATSGPDSQHP